MASAFLEDDDFDEYNPHPYQGGYNIVLTYGPPLPPSSATCYPIDGVVSALPPPVSTPTTPVHSADGDGAAAVPDLPRQVDPGYAWYDYPSFGSFGFYGHGCRDDAEENSLWRPLRRAADYLFGYSQGFGERRIGVDSYGIPIYANKKHGYEQALSLQAQPAINHKLEFHEWPVAHGEENEESAEFENRENEGSFYAYENHQYEQHIHVSLGEPAPPSWSWNAVYHKNYEELERENESHSYGNPIYAYERHQYEQPLSVEIEPVEHSWIETFDHHEVYEEQESSDSNWYSSSYGEWGNERHASESSYYNNEITSYVEQPECGELEPYQPTWSRFQGYFQDYKYEVPHESYKNDDPREIVAQFFSPFQNYQDSFEIGNSPWAVKRLYYARRS
ncbi:hypothetical protein J5N97_013613 [Dioscorea zingiberensis]|uniref:Uncharacterized protein n=1 Tax=Dioscorea zingiberensis TaxID=325984 RepID=A0A9D5HIZ8_9LILI|nr:hypothetical protein J5N97_013613 [Dioscorea zingiberensis]